MSFLGAVVGFLKSRSIASSLVKTALLGAAVNKIQKSILKKNQTAATDRGVRLQVAPATDHKVPVVYGTAYLGGIITDAVMTNNNKTMFYCVTICECTGNKLSDGQPSSFVFKDVYWNDQRVVFKEDGITAEYTVDRSGLIDRSISNLVKIYPFKKGSAEPTGFENYAAANTANAATIMPEWTTATHTMNELAFAIVRVDYNRDKNITGIGDLVFQMENNMRLPGDCIYDYMTNTRYGAGIAAQEIQAQ